MLITTILLVTTGFVLFSFYMGYFIFMLRKSRQYRQLNTEYNHPVSVILPTYNEEATIKSKLRNLLDQNYPMEVVLIDSASQDRTLSLAMEFMEDNELYMRIISEKERRGKASALNHAFKHCNYEIVVITDSDSIWEKGALKRAVSNFYYKEIGAVTGRQVLINADQTFTTKLEKSYRDIYEILRVGESVLDSTPIFHGELSCFRRNLIELINERSMADDSELAIKMRKKGFKSIYDPNVVFYEYAPPTPMSRFKQKVRRGQGLIELFLRERKLVFNNQYGPFGRIVFPAEFFMHVISPTLLFLFMGSFILSLDLFSVLFGAGILLISSLLIRVSTEMNVLRLIFSFLQSQFILLISLFNHLLGRSQHKWGKIEEVRELWRKESTP